MKEMDELPIMTPIDISVHSDPQTFTQQFNDTYDKQQKKSFLFRKAIIQFSKRIWYIIKL